MRDFVGAGNLVRWNSTCWLFLLVWSKSILAAHEIPNLPGNHSHRPWTRLEPLYTWRHKLLILLKKGFGLMNRCHKISTICYLSCCRNIAVNYATTTTNTITTWKICIFKSNARNSFARLNHKVERSWKSWIQF